MTTPLVARLCAEIAASGPIRIDRFMQACLLDPEHGYYTTREPFGQAGDFITAPEISQMFGELLGLALAQAWLDQGCPAPFVLCEIGPGRGTLMADMLRASRAVPGFHAAMQLWLVEPSRRLRAQQSQALARWPHSHADSLDALPEAPLFLVANEAFDALPIRQFQWQNGQLSERMVAVTETGDRLRFALSPPLAERPDGLAERPNTVVEYCPDGQRLAAMISARIQRGGAAYLIDYGGEGGVGDTLQALYRGQPDDPLAHPGQADLTAHVDFAALHRAASAAGAQCSGPIEQGRFLHALGIGARASALARSGDPKTIEAAFHRLTHRDEMGQLFKVLAIAPRDASALPGMTE